MHFLGILFSTVLTMALAGPVKASDLSEELAVFDISRMAEQHRPDWTAPEALQKSRGPVVYEQQVKGLATGHHLYGLYVFAHGDWHLFGIRVVLPDHDPGDVGGVYQLGAGRYEGTDLNQLGIDNATRPGAVSARPCKDHPDMHSPSRTDVKPGITAEFSWSGEDGNCRYRATYEFGSQDGGDTGAWITTAFEWRHEAAPLNDLEDGDRSAPGQ